MQIVQILNLTRKIVLAEQAQCATSLGQRMKGLLGRQGLQSQEGLILRPCSSIHTFFMRFAIDVLFLNKDMQIIHLIPNMPPNRLSPLIWPSYMAIELACGKISQTNTQKGDRIQINQLLDQTTKPVSLL